MSVHLAYYQSTRDVQLMGSGLFPFSKHNPSGGLCLYMTNIFPLLGFEVMKADLGLCLSLMVLPYH